MSEPGIVSTTTTSMPADDGADAAAAAHELGDARAAVLRLRARDHREEHLRDAEEHLVGEEREELTRAIDGDPLVRGLRRR